MLGKVFNNLKSVSINGNVVSGNIVGGDLIIDGNNITVNGEKIDLDKNRKDFTIEIVGDVGNITVKDASKAKVIVTGNSGTIDTMSGNVKVDGDVSGNIKTMSGDVKCSDIGGSVKTMSGDIRLK